MSRFDAVLESETNRSKALRGEVVLVTNERLEEMQEQAVRDEGVGYADYHWHWAAIINELIAHRKSMKLKRREWNAMCTRVENLQRELAEVRRQTLMPISTGDVLISVIVPELLRHLKLEARHGYAGLFPASGEDDANK